MPAASVRDTDKGWRGTLSRVKEVAVRGFAVRVGVQGGEAAAVHKKQPKAPKGEPAPEPMTVAMVAAFHELGIGVPERSWLVAWVEANRAEIVSDLRSQMARILLGKSTRERSAELLGLKYQAGIQKFISDGKVKPDIAQVTKDRKDSSVPLIDTGQLRSAITYAVEKVMAS